MSIRRLPRTVVILGLVSFFNDLASEMVTPLIPILIAGTFVAGPMALGAIEGTADAVSALLRLWSGRLSDALGGKRKGLTLAGFALSNAVRPLFGLAGGWPGLLALRSIDRIGKGIRSAPRDALIADSVAEPDRGLAFGFHRALDNSGAVLGALAAALVLSVSALTVSEVIAWSALPGVAVILLIVFGVKEAPHPTLKRGDPLPTLRWGALSRPLRRYLGTFALFTFARASEAFIVWRGHELGLSTVTLLLLWAALSLAKASTSVYGGGLSDRFDRRSLVAYTWLAHGLGYALLATISSVAGLWLIAIVFGLIAGLAEGGERAIVSDFCSEQERGTAYGWFYLVAGAVAIPAGLAFGAIWAWLGASGAFGYAALMAVCASGLLRWVARSPGLAAPSPLV